MPRPRILDPRRWPRETRLLVVTIVFRDEFLPGRGTAAGFAVAVAVMTGVMAGFHVLQDRRHAAPRIR